MSQELPPALADVIERIAAPEPSTAPLPPDATGALGDLAAWWRTVSGGAPLAVAELDPAAPASVPDAIAAGIEAAERAIDSGATLIVPRVHRRDDEAARTLIALLTRKEASAVVAQPDGMTDRAWMAACAAVRDRAAETAEHRGDPVSLLAAVDAPGIALVVGVLLGAAARRTRLPGRRHRRTRRRARRRPPLHPRQGLVACRQRLARPGSRSSGRPDRPRAGAAPQPDRRCRPRRAGHPGAAGTPGAAAYSLKCCISCWIRSSLGTFGRGPKAPQAVKASAMPMPKIAQTGQK